MSGAEAISAAGWRENWRAVCPDGGVRSELSWSRLRRRASLAAVAELASGTPVVVCASAPRAAARCRAFARAAGIDVEREYLAFPSAAAPAYLVENEPETVRLFATSVLTGPPRIRGAVWIDIGLHLLRSPKSWRLLRLLAPGRVAVGRRV